MPQKWIYCIEFAFGFEAFVGEAFPGSASDELYPMFALYCLQLAYSEDAVIMHDADFDAVVLNILSVALASTSVLYLLNTVLPDFL